MDMEKMMSDLHKSGYFISKQHLCGFSISGKTDELDPLWIQEHLDSQWLGRHICCFDQLDSTNDLAQMLAQHHAPEGTAVLTDYQTSGRGRVGRVWQIPPGRGLLFSFLLYPSMEAAKIPLLTLATAVGAVKALIQTTGVDAGIKWPNDLIVQNRKLGGILSEARFAGSCLSHVVIGVGINVHTQRHEWPVELRDTAISLQQATGIFFNRNELFSAICRECEHSYNQTFHDPDPIIQDWTRYSKTLGKEITVQTPSEEYHAVAEGISGDGALVVRTGQGEMRTIYMGDISIRHGRRQNDD